MTCLHSIYINENPIFESLALNELAHPKLPN